MKKLIQIGAALMMVIGLSACTTKEPTKEPFKSEIVEIPSTRNTNIKATLVVPSEEPEQGYPLVVFAHGFQGNREESGAFTETAEGLAKQGIASIRIDFPGCGESEEDFLAYTLDHMQEDVTSALDYTKKQIKVNEERVGLLGYSMGGRVASLYLDETKIHTAVLWAPAASNGLDSLQNLGSEEEMLNLIEDSKESGIATIQIWNNDVKVAHDFLKQSSEVKPLDSLGRYTGNLLVITGGSDTTVVKSISDQAIAAAVNTNITTHLDVPRATHALGAGEYGNDPAAKKAVVDASIHFFVDWLNQ